MSKFKVGDIVEVSWADPAISIIQITRIIHGINSEYDFITLKGTKASKPRLVSTIERLGKIFKGNNQAIQVLFGANNEQG